MLLLLWPREGDEGRGNRLHHQTKIAVLSEMKIYNESDIVVFEDWYAQGALVGDQMMQQIIFHHNSTNNPKESLMF